MKLILAMKSWQKNSTCVSYFRIYLFILIFHLILNVPLFLVQVPSPNGSTSGRPLGSRPHTPAPEAHRPPLHPELSGKAPAHPPLRRPPAHPEDSPSVPALRHAAVNLNNPLLPHFQLTQVELVFSSLEQSIDSCGSLRRSFQTSVSFFLVFVTL